MSSTTSRTVPRRRIGSAMSAAGGSDAATAGARADDAARSGAGGATSDLPRATTSSAATTATADDAGQRAGRAARLARWRSGRPSLRGVGRVLWFVATSVSLLICCASAVFWARSYVSGEGVSFGRNTTRVAISSTSGVLVVTFQHVGFDSPEAEVRYKDWADPTGMLDWSRWRVHVQNDNNTIPPMENSTLGFGMLSGSGTSPTRSVLHGVSWQRLLVQGPHWSILLLTGIAPALRLYGGHRLRRDRVANGQCRKCGYPLGEVYHSCPECGERRAVAA